MYKIVFTKAAQKDSLKIKKAGLVDKVESLLLAISNDPLSPPAKKLVGDLKSCYSRRINISHRLLFQVIDALKVIKILRM
jgi:Txe/YoeB family toxin of toxin-antitoxin system